MTDFGALESSVGSLVLEAEVASSASCSVDVGSDEVDAAAGTSKPD